jgi:hypothetical protein
LLVDVAAIALAAAMPIAPPIWRLVLIRPEATPGKPQRSTQQQFLSVLAKGWEAWPISRSLSNSLKS